VTLPELQTLVNAGDIAGRTIAWREAGQGQALVLLHGIGGASASWEYQFDYFSDRFRVIAWDMPGYGFSGGFDDPAPTVDDYVAALSSLLDALGETKAHVLGQSIAALIAARFAAKFRGRTRSFSFAHGLTGFGGLPAEERDNAKAGRLEVFDAMGPTRFAYEKGPAIMSPKVSDEAREKAVGIMAQINPAGFHQAVEMLAAADFFADAPHIAAPSLVLCGTDDPVAPEAVCRSAASALPDAEFHLLSGVGHYAAMENSILFNKTLEAFLETLT
jgi:pimeloyl-ACP methyl ester carboxylesterase